MSTNLPPSNPSPQKLTLVNDLEYRINKAKTNKIHDDFDNIEFSPKFNENWKIIFDSDNPYRTLNNKTYKIIKEMLDIKKQDILNSETVETKEVKENVHKESKESKGMYAPYYDELDSSPVYNSMSIYSQRIYANILVTAKKVEYATKRKEIDYCYSHCPCIVSKRVFYECLKELKDNGFIFIKETKLGKSNKITLSDYWRNRKPKTNKLMKHRESKHKTISNDKSYIGK